MAAITKSRVGWLGPDRCTRIGSLLSVVVCVACGSSGPTDPDPAACAIRAPTIASFSDLGNAADGSDVVARLVPPASGPCLHGFRVLLPRADGVLADAAAALAVPTERAVALSGSFEEQTIDFADVGVDASGAAIVEDVAYRLQVVAFGDGDPVLLTSNGSVTLVNAAVVRTISPSINAGSGGLETDSDGNIYTADFGAALSGPPGTRIHRVTPEGAVTVWASGFLGASGNDRAENGDLFQSSIQGGTIHRVTPAGSVSTFATGLAGPVGVVALPGDTLMVAGCGDHTIRRVEPDGAVTTHSSSSLLSCPNGITRAADGNYYIANFSDGRILEMTPEGQVTVLAQLPSGNAGHILWGREALWVVDRRGNQLVHLTLEGTMTVVAGTGFRGLTDGPALQATLSLPNDVAFSPDGSRLYFNDVGSTLPDENVISPVFIRALIFAR